MGKKRRKSARKGRARFVVRRLVALAALFVLAVFGFAKLFGTLFPEEDALAASAQDAPPAYIVDPYSVISYELLKLYIGKLEATYPELISSFTIGESAEGRAIPAFSLGRGEMKIICTAAIHACESFTTNYILYVVDRYAHGYAADGTVAGLSYREILDSVTFVIVPMINPDGVNIALNGPDAAADPAKVRAMDLTGIDYDGWKTNANGVDLNRNFPYNWSGTFSGTTHPAARYYAGPSAASEPEVKALIELFASTDFALAVDFHIYGEVIYWKDNGRYRLKEEMAPLVNRLFEITGFEEAGEMDVSEFGGYLENYVRNTYNRYAITVELATASPYDPADFDRAVSEGVYIIPLVCADEMLREQSANEDPQAPAQP